MGSYLFIHTLFWATILILNYICYKYASILPFPLPLLVFLLKQCVFIFTAVDYCASEKHGCEHECVNADGSYFCRCAKGFALNPDKKTCTSKLQTTKFLFGCYCYGHYGCGKLRSIEKRRIMCCGRLTPCASFAPLSGLS